MDRELRQSWAARIVALGFIGSVLVGNAWLTHALLGAALPAWLQLAFIASLALVFAGGVGLVALAAGRFWRRRHGQVFAPLAADDDDDDDPAAPAGGGGRYDGDDHARS